MKVLLIGATGLAGRAVAAELAKRQIAVHTVARKGAMTEADISDAAQLQNLVHAVDHDIIYNCAANVNIADCDQDPDGAFAINALPLQILGQWSLKTGKKLLQVSTDHYYAHGEAYPHTEDEPVELLNHYARTKLQAEEFALRSPHALVARTAIVGVRNWPQPTFAEWVIDVVTNDKEVTLFEDAYSSLIDVESFAKATLDLLQIGASGLFNVASSEVFSKGDFIREVARQMGRSLTRASSGSVKSLGVARARCLGLSVKLAEEKLGYALPSLHDVVEAVVRKHEDGNASI